MSADLTTAEQSAKALLDSVRDHRDLLQAQESRLSDLQAKRAELETFTRIDTLKLAESCHQHDQQIIIARQAVVIDKARLLSELGKSEGIHEALEIQEKEFKRDADPSVLANRLYQPEFLQQIYSLRLEFRRAAR